MALFKPWKNQTAYLKMGLLGFQGSGKTYTAVNVAIGLHRLIKSTKPVVFLDTETGSDWAGPEFDRAGIQLHVAKTKAFSDLTAAFPEAEKNASILIIDSVSHYWTELIEAYKRKKNIRARMAFHHWQPIKAEWAGFSELFVNSQLHVIVCGRAQWMYDYEEDDEGNKDLIKTGTKMRAEGEFGYEPALLVEMERIRETAMLEGKPVGKIGARVIHRAHVIKDKRMDGKSMDGKTIDDPVFKDFDTHIQALNLGGEHLGVDASRHSDDFLADDEQSRSEWLKARTIALEEVEETMKLLWPGSTGKDKAMKVRVVEHLFHTKSWTAIQRLSLPKLEDGARVLKGLELLEPGVLADYDQVRAAIDGEAAKPIVPDEETPWGGKAEAKEEPKAEAPPPETEPKAPPEPVADETWTVLDGSGTGHLVSGYAGFVDIAEVVSDDDTFTMAANIAQHQTNPGQYLCSVCGKLDTEQGASCPHLEAVRKAAKESTTEGTEEGD